MKRLIILCMLVLSLLTTGCCSDTNGTQIINTKSEVSIDVEFPEPYVMYDIYCNSDFCNSDNIYIHFHLYPTEDMYNYESVIKETDSIRYFIRKPVFDFHDFEYYLIASEYYDLFANAIDNNCSYVECSVEPFRSRNNITITKTDVSGKKTRTLNLWKELSFVYDIRPNHYNIDYSTSDRSNLHESRVDNWLNDLIDEEIEREMYRED